MSTSRERKAFGNRMRTLRKARGLSQEALGDEAGLHRTYIGAIERGEQNISLDNINKIAKALKVKPSELL
jgi:transcriptional regulator with XRE-family HTH domain